MESIPEVNAEPICRSRTSKASRIPRWFINAALFLLGVFVSELTHIWIERFTTVATPSADAFLRIEEYFGTLPASDAKSLSGIRREVQGPLKVCSIALSNSGHIQLNNLAITLESSEPVIAHSLPLDLPSIDGSGAVIHDSLSHFSHRKNVKIIFPIILGESSEVLNFVVPDGATVKASYILDGTPIANSSVAEQTSPPTSFLLFKYEKSDD